MTATTSVSKFLIVLLMCAVIASRSCFTASGPYVQAQKSKEMFKSRTFPGFQGSTTCHPKTRFGIFFPFDL